MTARQVYEGALIEMNKVQAPSLLLEDFNYLFNKAIYQYINRKYNIYDVNQQTTDDVRVLKATAIIPATKANIYNADSGVVTTQNALYGGTYEVILPSDYLHILNCVCNFKVNKQFKCYDPGTYVQFPAIRLTADAWSQVINNFYMRPMYKRPYFYVHNVNTSPTNPTNPYRKSKETVTYPNINGQPTPVYTKRLKETSKDKSPEELTDADYDWIELKVPGGGTDISTASYIEKLNFTKVEGGLPNKITIGGEEVSNVERAGQIRYGNASNVRMEIRYGKDDSLFTLENVYVDYLKTPQYIRLTQEQLDLTEDTSQMMEFPDYICQEIINELVHIVMENSSDPRLQSHIPISQSIANPAQQQEQPRKK